jgi:hypothetical protein
MEKQKKPTELCPSLSFISQYLLNC